MALLVAVVAGCKKSEPATDASGTKPATNSAGWNDNSVLRLHWLGRQRLAADTNAEEFLGIWKLPESARLENQTLDKLALAPWRVFKGDAATNGAPTSSLRPLLDDLVQEETYLEVRQATNQPVEWVLAVRLSEARARLWETNLATVIESLTGL